MKPNTPHTPPVGGNAPSTAPPKQSPRNARGAQSEKKSSMSHDLIRPLRTYKDDVARALGKDTTSLVDIVAAEQVRQAKRAKLAEGNKQLQEEIEREGAKVRETRDRLERERKHWGTQTRPHQERKQAVPSFTPPLPKRDVPHNLPVAPAPTPPTVQKPTVRAPAPASIGTRGAPRREAQLAEMRASEARISAKKEKLARDKQTLAQRMPARLAPQTKKSNRRSLLILGCSAALILAASGLSYVAYVSFQNRGTVTPERSIPTFVSTNIQNEVVLFEPFSRVTLIDTIEFERGNLAQPAGSVAHLHFIQSMLGNDTPLIAKDFLAVLAPTAPGSFTRSLEPEFTFGFHNRETNEPFLVAKTRFFENAFAGMLQWEARMRFDLAPLFGNPAATASRVSEDTAFGKSVTGSTTFVDMVIQNKDTRALLDENERIVLLYSFIDRETIVITTNTDTFKEILGRMNSGRVVR